MNRLPLLRAFGVTGVTLLVVVVTPFAATPARADVVRSSAVSSSSAIAPYTYGDSRCTITNDSHSATPGTPLVLDGTTPTQTSTDTAMVSDTTDPAYSGTAHASATTAAHASTRGARLAKVDMTTTFDASIDTTDFGTSDGSCSATPAMEESGQASFDVVLGSATAVTVGVDENARHLFAPVPSGSVSIEPGGYHLPDGSTATPQTVVLAPGDYRFTEFTRSSAQFSDYSDTSTQTDHVDISVHFAPAGSASTDSEGAGSSYVTFDRRVDCASSTLAGHLTRLAGTGRARTIRKAALFVDGRHVQTLVRPVEHKTVSLPVGSDGSPKVTVRLALANGGVKKIERHYYACTARSS